MTRTMIVTGISTRGRRAAAAAVLAAFLLTPAGPARANPFFMGLGNLPGGSTFSLTVGLGGALSADGSVVVGRGVGASGQEAFRWTSGGGMVGLGDLAGGNFFSEAAAVSADGSVVVGRSVGAAGNEAFRWTSGGGMVSLGDLPLGGAFSSALGVSADGSVVVGRGTSTSGAEAFRWTSGGMVGLGDLADGDSSSHARGVSADGLVVVGQGASASGNEAFRWTSGGGMVGLGDLGGGGFSSQANGVSADGSVVVGDGDTASGIGAFVWDMTNGMRLLQDVLVMDFGLGPDLSGWTLQSARGISGDGLTFAGFGVNPAGATEAWIASIAPAQSADVPEPGTLALLGFGLAGLGVMRRRRRST